MISKEKLIEFQNNGFVKLENFYSFNTDILPIITNFHHIIGLFIQKYNIPITQKPFHIDSYGDELAEIAVINRSVISEIYDVIKQIPSFKRLVTKSENEILIKTIRNTKLAGLCTGSYGIRIDLPNEDKFRTNWHQDFLAQFGSEDGIVFWTPLVNIFPELGPVEFCVGSHKDGVQKVTTKDNSSGKTGAYSIKIHNENEVISRYQRTAPLSNMGDLILIDFQTLHASGYNISNNARVSIQFRYFNFHHPSGSKLGWTAGYGSGKSLEDIAPEYVI